MEKARMVSVFKSSIFKDPKHKTPLLIENLRIEEFDINYDRKTFEKQREDDLQFLFLIN